MRLLRHLSLILATAVLVGSTLWFFQPSDSWLAFLGVTATLTGVFQTAGYFLYQAYKDRELRWPVGGAFRVRVTFWLYVALVAFGVLGIGAALVNFYSLFDGRHRPMDVHPEPGLSPSFMYVVFLDLMLPLVLGLTLIALHFKVSSVASLDAQKLQIHKLAREFGEFRRSQNRSVGGLLEKTLRLTVEAAACTGGRTQAKSDLAALILVPDFENKRFLPLKVFSRFGSYRKALESVGGVPTADLDAFFSEYNATVDVLRRHDSPADQGTVTGFREQTKKIVSATGIVYSLQTKIVNKITPHCLVFRNEYLQELESGERDACHFREMVGLPLTVNSKCAGVCLILATQPDSLYGRDKVYWILTEFLENGLGAAYDDNFKGVRLLIDNAPGINEVPAGRRTAWKRKLNEINHEFTEKV